MSAGLSANLSCPEREHPGEDVSRPRVSVVIPCYNAPQFLSIAIESVLNQTFQDFEIIVVDDGSEEDISSVVSSFPRVKYLRQLNRGTAAARNTGWRASTGEYIVFLDADDWLMPNALAIGASNLDSHAEVGLTFGRSRIVRAGSSEHIVQEPIESTDFYVEMLRGCAIWHPAAMMCRRSIFSSGIEFDESFKIGSDFDFYLQVGRRFRAHCHNELISDYFQHDANKSHNLIGSLNSALAALRKQQVHALGTAKCRRAYAAGLLSVHMLNVHKIILEFSSPRSPSIERQRIFKIARAYAAAPWTIPFLWAGLIKEAEGRKVIFRLVRMMFVNGGTYVDT